MFLNLALKKRAIASCSPQYFHINKKKTWKVLISCFLQLSQLPFSKTEKVLHSDIRGQNHTATILSSQTQTVWLKEARPTH